MFKSSKHWMTDGECRQWDSSAAGKSQGSVKPSQCITLFSLYKVRHKSELSAPLLVGHSCSRRLESEATHAVCYIQMCLHSSLYCAGCREPQQRPGVSRRRCGLGVDPHACGFGRYASCVLTQ